MTGFSTSDADQIRQRISVVMNEPLVFAGQALTVDYFQINHAADCMPSMAFFQALNRPEQQPFKVAARLLPILNVVNHFRHLLSNRL